MVLRKPNENTNVYFEQKYYQVLVESEGAYKALNIQKM